MSDSNTPERIEAFLLLFKIALLMVVLIERSVRKNIRERAYGLENFMPNRVDVRNPRSEYMLKEFEDAVKRVARSAGTSILIEGETGTGKELIARAIHYRSPRFKGPMLEVNCAAIPKDLIESKLFGYEKGAFSGAGKTGKEGLVEKAANGTLFLAEVGDLSMEAYAKLLRFPEEGEYYRAGGANKRSVQTRIVSATNAKPHIELKLVKGSRKNNFTF